jgi:arginine N-succinyltransferase
MLVIRPIEPRDLDALMELTELTGFGLTTLPHDHDLLKRRIRESEHGFDQVDESEPRGEAYLFVLEDLGTGKIIGTSGVVSKVGGFDPFYAYRIESQIIASDMLKVRKEVKTLHLVTEHNGPSEIGSLFLHPGYRKGGNGWLLSLSRFLFMAEHRQYFDPVVIAEMRGVVDDDGTSPFWEALGRHFFEIDYPKADLLRLYKKRFIADLMPRHPIYELLLPEEARAVIGEVHEQTRPALKMLQQEGFSFSGMVDIFEAGPVITCPLDSIRTVKDSKRATVAEITDEPVDSPPFIVSCTRRSFRATKAPLQEVNGGVKLNAAAALALGVKTGDAVRFIPLHGARPTPPSPPPTEPAGDKTDVETPQGAFRPRPLDG